MMEKCLKTGLVGAKAEYYEAEWFRIESNQTLWSMKTSSNEANLATHSCRP
jgi:hypothetical protein